MKKIMELLDELHPEYDFASSDDFNADGLIDSVDLQHLTAMIETEYGVHLSGTDLLPQNFSSVEAMEDLLECHGVQVEK